VDCGRFDIKTVSIAAGHSTAKLTLDTYGHLMGAHADRAAMARVNRALGYGTDTDLAATRTDRAVRPKMAVDLGKRSGAPAGFEPATPTLGL
jgi:hypothetical protein